MADSNDQHLHQQQQQIHQQHQNPIIIEDDQDVVSEFGSHQEEGKPLKIINLLQNLFVLGMTSLTKWEDALNHMKTHPEVTGHPVLLQVWFTFSKMLQLFQKHVLEKSGSSQKHWDELTNEDYEFEDLTFILKPLINKKPYKDQEFSFDMCQTIMNVIRSKLITKSQCSKDNKKSEKRKLKQKPIEKKQKVVRRKPSPSSSSSSSSSSESEGEDQFAKIFKPNKNKPLVLSQMFQYRNGDKRRKLSTPGEEGTHLIKIEITDTRDLKSCTNEKMYWTKVSKKGLFLLNIKNEEDSNTFSQIDSILVKAAERVSKIKNVKKEELPADFVFKKN